MDKEERQRQTRRYAVESLRTDFGISGWERMYTHFHGLSLSLYVLSDSNPFPRGVLEIRSKLAKFREKSKRVQRT
jgi:hypothetical protein